MMNVTPITRTRVVRKGAAFEIWSVAPHAPRDVLERVEAQFGDNPMIRMNLREDGLWTRVGIVECGHADCALANAAESCAGREVAPWN